MSKCWSRRRVAAWFVSSHDPEALHRPPRKAVRVPISSRGTAAVHDFRLWPEGEVSRARCNVRFSNRPFGVKRFQAIHHHSVNVARGLVLLFGIGTKALPSWDSKTRWNNLSDGLAVSLTEVQADMRTHLIHRPARDIIPPLGGARVSFYWIRCCTVFMLLLWPVLGSSGTRCRQPRCGA